MQKFNAAFFSVAVAAAIAAVAEVGAHAPSGAIFTTLVDGSEVNFNHYAAKHDVYLDGGPGPGAPVHAAGLNDGRYVFQVTDPSGKRLLSLDNARCRQFDVFGGVIANVVATGCEHDTGFDVDHGATTVQLMPYADTPNRGGVYKAWAVRLDDFLAGCAALGVANGLNVVDCGYNAGNFHGFVPAHTKTDNFKVKVPRNIREIDTRFFEDQDGNGRKAEWEPYIDGLQIKWTDPLGSSNMKSSYYGAGLNIFHEAHVEAVEDGRHNITIPDQPGCKVGKLHLGRNDVEIGIGAQTVPVDITSKMKDVTVFIYVACKPL